MGGEGINPLIIIFVFIIIIILLLGVFFVLFSYFKGLNIQQSKELLSNIFGVTVNKTKEAINEINISEITSNNKSLEEG